MGICAFPGLRIETGGTQICWRWAVWNSEAGDGWAALPVHDVGVADVAEILDADFAGEEAVGGEVAQEGEEVDGGEDGWVLLCVLAEGDLVEDLLLLLRGAVGVGAAVAVGAGPVE